MIDIAASKTGALAILMDFYNYVKEYGGEHEWLFLTGIDCIKDPPPHIRVEVCSRVKRSGKDRLWFDLVSGARFVEAFDCDVIFSMQNTLPMGRIRRRSDLIKEGRVVSKKGDRVPLVLYLHQPLGYQKQKRFSFFIKEEREYAVYQYLIGALIDASVKKSDLCIVQTEWMKKAVAQKTGKDIGKLIKVLPDVGDMSGYAIDPSRWRSDHFFFPSGEILYKNHECVLKAVKLLNERGITDFKVHFTLKSLSEVTKRRYPDPHHNVIWSGRVLRREVLEEYGRGTLLFPSYIETFGVPLAEARGVGTLILASDTPFSREVLEGYENAEFFDPFSPEQLADLMEKVIRGEMRPQPPGHQDSSGSGMSSYGKIVEILCKRY